MPTERYDYLYPNPRSYALISRKGQHGDFNWQGRGLRHGYIFGYKDVVTTDPNIIGPSDIATAALRAAATRQINFQNYKIFQFNPPVLSMNTQMLAVDGEEVEIPGGALQTKVGLAGSTIELFFDRTNEIARSSMGIGDEKWRDIGVQWDLFDLLRVISGGGDTFLRTQSDETMTDPGDTGISGAVRQGSLNHLTGAMFDSAIAGSQIVFKSFVVVFNPNLAMHVQKMSRFTFTYLRFTSDLVPTTVKVEMDLEIINVGTKSYAVAAGGPAGASTAITTTPSLTTAPPGTRTTTPNPAYGPF